MKEPKLLAEIRASHARAEKAAKHAPPAPSGPQFVGTVETPANPNPPNNYIAQTLDECTTVEHCEALLAHAQQHRYSEDGQTVQSIRAKITELGGVSQRPPKTAAQRRAEKKTLEDWDKSLIANARKRGGRR